MASYNEPSLSDYTKVVEQIPYVFAALLVESLLFGIHFILFVICFYLLATRRNPAHIIILLSIIIMFALSVADVALSYRFILHDVPAVLKLQLSVVTAVYRVIRKGHIYVTNNLITDGLLIYRCYKVWGGKKYIILAAAAVLVADSIWGYLSVTVSMMSIAITFAPVFFGSIVAFNVVMTVATAGRIWWVARTARRVLGEQEFQRYNTAIAIIIESGAIYSIAVLFLIAIPNDKLYRVIAVVVATRVVCIMPALMIVQVELGQNFKPEPRQKPDLSWAVTNRFSTVPPSSMTASAVLSVELPPSIYRKTRSMPVLDIKREDFVLGARRLSHS